LKALFTPLTKTTSSAPQKLAKKCSGRCGGAYVSAGVSTTPHDDVYDVTNGIFSIGDGQLFNQGSCYSVVNCASGRGRGGCTIAFYIRDRFKDPIDFNDRIPWDIDMGTPYQIRGDWSKRWRFRISHV
jgi:hypothetical protein